MSPMPLPDPPLHVRQISSDGDFLLLVKLMLILAIDTQTDYYNFCVDQVFKFADTYRGSYNNSKVGRYVCPFYCDFSGYEVC